MSLGLNAAQLARMRAQAAALLPGTCTIQRATSTNDGGGGWTEGWADVATVACRMDTISARTRAEVQAAREAGVTYYTLTVPYDAPIGAGLRVVVDSVAYEIVEVHTAESWAVSRRARVAVLE